MKNEPSPQNEDAVQKSPGAPTTSGSPLEHQHASLFESPPGERFAFWNRMPLYQRILGAVIVGLLTGVLLGDWAQPLEIPSKLVLRLLGALAAPLILLAVIQALMQAEIPRGSGFKLVRLLVLNTLVAIGIGLLVANILQPGRWASVESHVIADAQPEQSQQTAANGSASSENNASGKEPAKDTAKEPATGGAFAAFLENIPKSFLGPFGDEGKVISVIILAVALGVALRGIKDQKITTVNDTVTIAFNVLIVILHWIIAVIPLAVFGIVASIIGTKGFSAFLGLGAFIIAVLSALTLQMVYYLTRIRFFSWVRPWDALRGTRDALTMAFSTASSTATMPVTYACLREKVKLRERSASLGSLVGANFNNDGTALYEAMAALFISQLTGHHLSLVDQFLVVLTSVAASVGAAGIPEAGIVTMTMVFKAVGLDVTFIPVLLAIDWFLDRCRTAVNVMGDVNVSCILDGRTSEESEEAARTKNTSGQTSQTVP